MSSEEVFNKVKEIIVEQLGVAENAVTEESSFIDDLGADSLDVCQIIMDLEDMYQITIDDEAAMNIKTVGDAVEQLEKLINA